MSVLHLWAIGIGGLALALPVLVHWLTKAKPVRLGLSTLRFVQEAVKQRRVRHRLRDILILSLRALAVALLALAFARPLTGEKPPAASETKGGVDRVVVLDVSHSMGAVVKGIAAFERARPAAKECLAYEPGLRANLILAGARPRAVFDRPSSNMGALGDALGQAEVRPERLNLQAAISEAAEMLARAPAEAGAVRRELVIISDLQRTNWAGADFSALPKDTVIQLKTVGAGDGTAPENLGISNVEVSGRAEQGRETRIEVEVGNYTKTARPVQVDLTIGGSTCRMEKPCAAGTRTTMTAEVVLAAAGWQTGEARLVGVEDALPSDNVRAFVVEVRPAPTYLLVTRETGAPRPSSSFFLERALAPLKGRDGAAARGERVERVDAGAIDQNVLAPVDLVVLDHPGKLANSTAGLLADRLRRGMPILYVASEATDAANLRLLSDAAGSNLRMPVEFVPAAGGTRKDLFLVDVQKTDPLFAVFGESLTALVGPLRFSGGLSSRTLATGLANDVVATYSDRTACLVTTACGGGTLAVLNVDLNSTNLVGSDAFVVLLGELTSQLLSARAGQEAVLCGEPLATSLPADAGGAAELRVVAPAAGPADNGLGQLVDENGAAQWRWEAVGGAGAYRIMRGSQTVYAVAAGIPREEMDLTALSAEVVKSKLVGERTVYVESVAEMGTARDRFWEYLAEAAMCCLLSEVVLLRLFRV